MSLGEREDELLDTLEAVIDPVLPYVLVSGWAIAASNQHFTTDVDAVIPAQAVDDYPVAHNDNCVLAPFLRRGYYGSMRARDRPVG